MAVFEARWVPGWYDLDQPIQVGRVQTCYFYQETPPYGAYQGITEPIFFNTLQPIYMVDGRAHRIEVPSIKCQVVSITHESLGRLQGVRSEGLDYVFILEDGDEIWVNAEEEPGVTEHPLCKHITDWNLRVTLEQVGE